MARRECPNCKGTGKCPECDGKGKTTNFMRTLGATIFTAGIVPLIGGSEKDKCKICNGGGKCRRCRGKGHIPKD
jgi:hypothetical protein